MTTDTSSTNHYETVNRPSHYDLPGLPGVQVIAITKHLPHCRGSAVEYILRAGKKPGVDPVEDLEKAIFHLHEEIDRIKIDRIKQVEAQP